MRISRWQRAGPFVSAKNRVAPLKQLSIPRLELQAAVLALRLNCLIKRGLTINAEEAVFWIDSKTVLQYIANKSGRFHTFVANRVSEIHDASKPSQWRHVPGRFNPADDCTHGLRVTDLNPHCRWLAGLAFLSQSEDQCPQDTFVEPLRKDDTEVKTFKWSGHFPLAKQEPTFQTRKILVLDTIQTCCWMDLPFRPKLQVKSR